MTWQIFAIGAPLLFVIYQAFAKMLPSDVSPLLINAYASAMGAIVLFLLYMVTSPVKALSVSSKSFWLALGIGVLVSIGNAAIIKAYLLGAPQSSFSAIYYPLLITYAIIFSVIFWHEKLNLYQVLGVALSVIGILLVLYFKR